MADEPTVPIRDACAQRLVDMMRVHPQASGVVIEPGWMGEQRAKKATIWIGEIQGRIEANLCVNGRRVVDDIFTLPVYVRVAGHPKADAARLRLGELVGVVHDVVVDTASLESMPGVISALPADTTRQDVRTTPSDGFLGFAVYPVEIHTRLN